ncbi:MAG: VPLPA-CTERM sorting domain-containing protein [Pseudomonadota bacterium]
MRKSFAAAGAVAALSFATSAQALVLEADGAFLNIDGISSNPMQTWDAETYEGPLLNGVSVRFELYEDVEVAPESPGAGDRAFAFAAGAGGNAASYTGLPGTAGVSGSHNVGFRDILVEFDNDSTDIPLAVAQAFGIDGYAGYDLIAISGYHDSGYVEGDGVARSSSREFSLLLIGEGDWFPEDPAEYNADLLSDDVFRAVQLTDFMEDHYDGGGVEPVVESAGLGPAETFSVTDARVPLPAALPLLGAGLAALGVMARRRRAA